MSIRVMLDTDILADLDGHAELLATYSDLVEDQAALAALRAKHPHSQIILIDRALGDPTGEATVFDMEAGADSVAELPRWIAEKKAAGKRYLTGYCDRNNLPAVLAIAEHEIWHWVATLDGTCHVAGFTPMRSPAAVQILGAGSVGVHADLSIVLEDGWHPREAAAATEEPFQADAAATDSAGSGHPDSGVDPGPAPASSTVEELAAKAPAWHIFQDGERFVADLIGHRSTLIGETIQGLEAIIRLTYPELIK